MGRKRKGEVLRTERSPMMCQKEHDKEEMGRPIKRHSLILTYHQPHRVTSGQVVVVFKHTHTYRKEKKWKKERKITEVKRPLQSTKENRTPKVEKLSGTQSKKQTKTRRKTNKKGEDFFLK